MSGSRYRSISELDIEKLVDLGTMSIGEVNPAYSTQLVGDDDGELRDRLMFTASNPLVQPTVSDYFYSKLLYMHKKSRSSTYVPSLKDHEKSITNVRRASIPTYQLVGPSIFDIVKEYQVGEEVLVLPEVNIVWDLLKFKKGLHPSYGFSFYTRTTRHQHPLFLMIEPYTIIGVRHYNKEAGFDGDDYWPLYILERKNKSIDIKYNSSLYLPASMMCRPVEAVGFIA